MQPFTKIICLATSLLVITSCKKEKEETNKPPSANAGFDMFFITPTNDVLVDGRGFDREGQIASYTWTLVSGPSTFHLNNSNLAQAKIDLLDYGIYQFQLKITDNIGQFDTDEMRITVDSTSYLKGPWDYE